MVYKEEDFLMLSGLQHFFFCKRQWALIHIEQQWAENKATMEGMYLHRKADNPFLVETRKDILISRAIPISSKLLGVSGIIDVLELVQNQSGIVVPGKNGLWRPNVVEYKRGKPKTDNCDIIQLVAQVICLEEKLNYKIENSELFYHEVNRRTIVNITDELRNETLNVAKEMHRLYEEKLTPVAESYKNCTRCSLYDICMPRLTKKKSNISNYIDKFTKGDEEII